MRRFLILLVLLCFGTITVIGQSGCDIELEDTILNMIQAQRAADAGDTLKAVAILEGVQASIDGVTSGCDSVRLESTYTTPDDLLSFKYPAGWQVQNIENNLYLIVSSSDLIELLDSDLPQSMNPSDGAIALQIQALSDDDTYDDLVDDLVDDMGGDISILGRPEEIEFRGRRTTLFNVRVNEFVGGQVALVDYSDVEDMPSIALMFGLSNVDSMPIITAYTNALRESIQFPPGQSLREIGVSADDLSYTSINTFDDDDNPSFRYAYLSVDGTQIAYSGDGTVCILTIAQNDETCATLPLTFESRPTALQWSPDGRYIALHPDLLRMFVESDIWVYDIEADNFVNLTDDGVDDIGFGSDIESETWLDFAITWGPDNMIYGIRQTVLPGSDGLVDGQQDLIRVDPATGEVNTSVDFSMFEFGAVFESTPYSLNGTMAVSPDATQIAVGAKGRDRNDPNNGVWVIDLASGDAEQVASFPELYTGLPATIREQNHGLVTGISWDADGTGLFVTIVDPISTFSAGMLHHIDLTDGDIVPLADLSELSNREMSLGETDDESPVFVPRGAVLTPDYQAVIVVHSSSQELTVSLVPFDGTFGDPQELFTSTETRLFSEVIQMGLNGNLLLTRAVLENDN